jgi:hypothetical protein
MREKYSKIQFISVVSDILSIVAFFSDLCVGILVFPF